MNKGKNKGKIQKSRQNAEGREAGSFLGKAYDSFDKYDFSNWNRASFYDENV